MDNDKLNREIGEISVAIKNIDRIVCDIDRKVDYISGEVLTNKHCIKDINEKCEFRVKLFKWAITLLISIVSICVTFYAAGGK